MTQPGSHGAAHQQQLCSLSPADEFRLYPFLAGMCSCPQTAPSAHTQKRQAAGAIRVRDERTRRLYPSSLAHMPAGLSRGRHEVAMPASLPALRLGSHRLWGWGPSQPTFATGSVGSAKAQPA